MILFRDDSAENTHKLPCCIKRIQITKTHII
jgi:hypothetical protein